MKYKLVIFDLDGTILDTLDDLADSMNHVLELHGFPIHSRDDIRRFVGNGIMNLIKRAAPQGSDEATVNALYEDFVLWYKDHCLVKTAPYPGITEMLSQLKAEGVKTAVVSNKGDFAVQELISEIFPEMFDMAVGERQGIRRKPAPDSVNEVLEKLGVSADDSVYIGDSDVDIETAGNAGMPCVSVTWGFRDKEFLLEHGAAIFADNSEELKKYLI